ncbi:hypothetical protein ACJRO7_025969 [Eucalyptus globulus]|uniref:Gnk2-homologous domain-containing protein n=1 Tax=Eucalyptus globulus TaxID=34317 RepID=A0ABD3KFN6_EUCGL
MAAFRGILAIGIWFLCIPFSVYCLPDTTVVCKICNGINFSYRTPFRQEMNSVLNELGSVIPYSYNLYAQSTNSGQGCYGHAACDGRLSHFDCDLCLQNERGDLLNGCSSKTGRKCSL